jgi:hypothetical protein
LDDPTRNARQRLYAARKRAEREGKVEVTVAEGRWFVSAALAEAIRLLCERDT